MPRRNRVDPWGDLQAVEGRGLFTGNRGCLVDQHGQLVRHHAGRPWITCMLSWRGLRQPLDRPGTWTPVFLLDDALALAAGHRPCARCRRDAYRAYRSAVGRVDAAELDARLAAERLRPGRGLERRHDRRPWWSPVDELPDGAVVVDAAGEARLLVGDRSLAFTPDGWDRPAPRPTGHVEVLTPPTSVVALRRGFVPVLHPSAA